ncbi:aminoglycoside 6-adenylyltransferase [Paenibacillus methanolicus]|uniref:Aminoglycoside 6-adenylyltransferase n=1 Tax=Paenibacillus methanolicus TaxID=582686 RepID=A0A5S5C5E5_9BACL|nr:aminoglycoside 6-adenylyltransferase [Paenibacillus methanolicus]
MRSSTDILRLLLDIAERDERIRLVTLEGSRTNRNVPADAYQDYDISYFVTDMETFKQSDRWLQPLGERLMMQKPEDMELFPPELGNWFSYLILFEDGVKLDLTLIPIGETDDYFAQSDGLVEVLLDKDARVPREIVPGDRQYWIRKPTAREFDAIAATSSGWHRSTCSKGWPDKRSSMPSTICTRWPGLICCA